MKPILLLLGVYLLAAAPLYSQISDKKAWKRYRKTKREELIQPPRGPLDKRTARKLRYFKYAPYLRVAATVTPIADGRTVSFATSSGRPRSYIEYAYLDFVVDGKSLRLTAYRVAGATRLPAAYRDHVFLPFNDLTNGRSSYGGGRYIDLRTGDLAVDNFFLDFNRAYNPYCAYAGGYSCPVPPLNNRLEVAIEAGECNFAADYR